MDNDTSTESGSGWVKDAEVIVVGGGLAGLSCADLLRAQGVDVRLYEGSDAVGGRIRTDDVEGFKLDRGFQVLLTAYDEVRAQFDMGSLELRSFAPGSMIWDGERLETLGDPFRAPRTAVASLAARVATTKDKLKVAALRRRLLAAPAAECFSGPERSTEAELRALGFSEGFIEGFFRPFLGGVFLERDLQTSASLFRYYFRCFAEGAAAVPAGGMQRLPDQLAQRLGDRVTLGAKVREVGPDRITLADGTVVRARRVVVAVDGDAASRLLGGRSPAFKSTITAYFASERAPTAEPMLVLDGVGEGPVNHVAPMSNVSEGYAPPGAHLIAVSGVGEAALHPHAFREAARVQLRRWFGDSVQKWRYLRSYHIPHALPRHPAGSLPDPRAAQRRRRSDGIIVAGDYTEFGSIQGALLSGRRAAEAVLGRALPKPSDVSASSNPSSSFLIPRAPRGAS